MLKQKEKQVDSAVVDSIATISVGRDNSAWNGTAGSFNTVENYKALSVWVRDTFIPKLTATNSLGKKMIMLDNWNEFGEGHFIMPTNLAGFGYLDAIRDTFTNSGQHSDVVPTQQQKDRINVLYPPNRSLPVVSYK